MIGICFKGYAFANTSCWVIKTAGFEGGNDKERWVIPSSSKGARRPLRVVVQQAHHDPKHNLSWVTLFQPPTRQVMTYAISPSVVVTPRGYLYDGVPK